MAWVESSDVCGLIHISYTGLVFGLPHPYHMECHTMGQWRCSRWISSCKPMTDTSLLLLALISPPLERGNINSIMDTFFFCTEKFLSAKKKTLKLRLIWAEVDPNLCLQGLFYHLLMGFYTFCIIWKGEDMYLIMNTSFFHSDFFFYKKNLKWNEMSISGLHPSSPSPYLIITWWNFILFTSLENEQQQLIARPWASSPSSCLANYKPHLSNFTFPEWERNVLCTKCNFCPKKL